MTAAIQDHVSPLIPRGTTAMRSAVLSVALGEVGTREATGKNDGPVEKYMPAWARGKRLPWCAWFVGWCWEQALGSHPYGQRYGGVWDLYRAALGKGDCLELHAPWPAQRPQPGDVFVMLSGDPGRRSSGHTGFVLRVSEDGERVNTVEGNWRNQVGIATRPLSDMVTCINPYSTVAEWSSVGWERGLIEAPLAGGLAGTR
jgi:hypothetical protein